VARQSDLKRLWAVLLMSERGAAMKVSVIILTYNRAKLLPIAINSVLVQTYQDFDIIVVDDASNDNTREVVYAIDEPRIRYIRNEVNKGESASRNIGVRACSSELITFLDDDDEWLPQKLELQIRAFEKGKKDVGLIYTGLKMVDTDSGAVLSEVKPKKSGDLSSAILTKNWIGTPSSVMIKRHCINAVGLFDENIVFGPDWDMWIRISKHYLIEFIDVPLLKYRIHNNRLSSNYKARIQGWETIRKKYRLEYNRNNQAAGEMYLRLGESFCFDKKFGKALIEFGKGILVNPYERRTYYNIMLLALGGSGYKAVKSWRRKKILAECR